MSIYDKFARFYTRGPYTKYSQRMAEILPAVLRALGSKPRTLLDLACGDGTFAAAAARQGLTVTGLDASAPMLQAACERIAREGVAVRLVEGDMRTLAFVKEFDLVTCWYDSLNYLLEIGDLERTFRGVAGALRPGGFFIFDMNTIRGLAVLARSQPCYVIQDAPGIFEVHINTYDFETAIASKRIVGFADDGGAWARVDELHLERGYRQSEITACLTASGLAVEAVWGSLQEMTAPAPDAGRMWFAAGKPSA
jgi:2-polyprenyl-3-methyl-5-hydroxy-6-metoxy-1,4-benzoquinol methylase